MTRFSSAWAHSAEIERVLGERRELLQPLPIGQGVIDGVARERPELGNLYGFGVPRAAGREHGPNAQWALAAWYRPTTSSAESAFP